MARWRKGEEQVTWLVEQRHLQQVAADSETAAALLASAGRHVENARRTAGADPCAAAEFRLQRARPQLAVGTPLELMGDVGDAPSRSRSSHVSPHASPRRSPRIAIR
jgi:hypothetical protein